MYFSPAGHEPPALNPMFSDPDMTAFDPSPGFFAPQPAWSGGDTVTPLQPPWIDNPSGGIGSAWNAALGTAMNPLGSIMSLLQQILGALQEQGNPPGCGREQYFAQANGASVGDPHLSFNGNTWDNMGNQPDLLHSDSFRGGFQVSTDATAPNASGVTYNRSATVTTNLGGTNVTLDNQGNATIAHAGFTYPIAAGQTMALGDGESVSRSANGSLQVTCTNQSGGSITTTLSENGNGVDVSVNANNVDLGGALVAGPPGTQPPHMIAFA